jgi:hypothetical protein
MILSMPPGRACLRRERRPADLMALASNAERNDFDVFLYVNDLFNRLLNGDAD